MNRNILKQPWVSQAVENTRKQEHGQFVFSHLQNMIRENSCNAPDRVSYMFSWSDTPQGYSYWNRKSMIRL